MKKIQLPEDILDKLAQSTVDRLLQGHYFKDGVIRGEELKSFADHQQVNRFLLFQVFQVWNMQLSKLKHPYFDFESEEIQKTLKELRNQLSRNIVISEKEFSPMLKRAVFNNLKLLLDPTASFTSFFFVNRDKATLELFETYAPFFSDFDFVVNSILRYHQKNQLNTVARDVFFMKMDKVIELYNSKSEIDIESYRKKIFRDLTQTDLDGLVQEHESNLKQKEEEELKRKKEEEERKRAEEEKRKKEEARKRAEEEKRKLEEAKKREAEEKRRQEEEKQRLEAERLQKEQERKKQSFFDTLDGTDTVFDFDIEESDEATPKVPEAKVAGETSSKKSEPEPDPIVPPISPEQPVTAEDTDKDNAVEPPPAKEEAIPKEEERPAYEPIKPEFIKPPFDTENVEEKPKRVIDQVEENTESEKPKTILDSLHNSTPNKSTIADSLISKKETLAESMREKEKEDQSSYFKEAEAPQKSEEALPKPKAPVNPETPPVEPEVKAPIPPVEEDIPAPPLKLQESLGDFIKKKAQVEEKEKKPSVVEAAISKHTEKPQTIQERIQAKTQNTPVHENLNGNRKIKLNEIPIHKQYQFVQKVFEGNNVRFRIIVDKVNNAKGKEEVQDIMNRFVLNNDNLEKDDAVVKEFLKLMENRF